MAKVQKGQYGYMSNQRKKVIIRTIGMFAIVLALFAMGIWSTGSKKNLLTVVAVLGCLPASKSFVNMIMFLRAKSCSPEAKERIEKSCKSLSSLFDMLFTSYEKNYQISHMVVKGQVVCGYTEDAKCACDACEKHLETMLKQGGCKGATVKIYNDLEKYCEGIDNLEQQEAETANEDILINLLSISL